MQYYFLCAKACKINEGGLYIITVISLPMGRTHYGFCLIFMLKGGIFMDKIIIALLGAAVVIVQQIFKDED